MSDYTVDLDTGCWVWRRAKTKAGYGQMYIDGKKVYAHRAYYEGNVAGIAPGLVIDHLYGNRACCESGSPTTCHAARKLSTKQAKAP
jgi:hypothetical protein